MTGAGPASSGARSGFAARLPGRRGVEARGPRVCAVWGACAVAQRLTWELDGAAQGAELARMRREGFRLTRMQASTVDGDVRYDGLWEAGVRPQEFAWGWAAADVRGDLPARAARGLLPTHVHGYQHLDHGTRYVAAYEPGAGNARLLLGASAEQLRREWVECARRGYQLAHLASHVHPGGEVRHSAVLRADPATPSVEQRLALDLTADELAETVARQGARGRVVRHVTLVRVADGYRWSAVFGPGPGGQFVHWADARARVVDAHARRQAAGYALSALWAAAE